MQQVDIVEAAKSLPNLIETAISGEEVIITRDNQPLVKLIPFSQSKPRPQFGSARGLITLAEDFDEPLEDFNAYMR